jgi:PAS domain S-box-containing protein
MRFIFLTSALPDHPLILLFCFLPALINLFVFLYVTFRFPKNTLNNYFAFFVLLLAAWQLSDCFMHMNKTAESSLWMYRASGIPAIGVAVFEVLFALQFTKWYKKISIIYYYLFLFIPSLILLMCVATGTDEYTIEHSSTWNWIAIPKPSLFVSFFYSWISLVSLLTSGLFLTCFLKAKKEDPKKKQALILFIGFTIPVAGGIITEVLAPLVLGIEAPPITVPLITVFSIASFIAISRYRLFEYSPRHQWENILKTMNEGLLIVDNEDTIMYANEMFCEMTGFTISELQGRTSASVLRDESKQLIHTGDVSAKEGRNQYIEVIRRRDGKKMWTLVSSSAYTDKSGNQIGSIGILTDITEMMSIQNKLNEKINELNLFFYKTSHDFKSPIASMEGLLAGFTKDDNIDEFMHYMRLCTIKLEKIVGRVSQLSLIQQKKIYTAPLNSREVISKILDELEQEQPFRHFIKVHLNIDAESIQSEKFLLGLILKNLIENAVKYSDEKKGSPFINISIDKSDVYYKILVTDNGLGIDYEIQDKVFEMFYRGNERSKGAGLGLYIVKAAAEKLGGKVSLKSGPKDGTAVKVILPVPTVS